MDPKLLQELLPLLVIGGVFVLRFRNLKKPRPFSAARLWMVPVLLAVIIGLFVVSIPPTKLGWIVMGFALVLGTFAGIKRGQWMHLERDPQSGALMIRQSPAALIALVGILIVRRVLAFEFGGTPGADAHGNLAPQALLVTDGLMAFALGMVVLMRWTLWQRAKAVPPHPEVFS